MLVALALIEGGMKYEDAVQFIRQYVVNKFFSFALFISSLNVGEFKYINTMKAICF